jgi:hypothetical protein
MSWSIVTNVTRALAAYSLSNMNAKPEHAHFIRSRHTLRKLLSPTCHLVNMLSLNFLWKRESRQKSSKSDFVVCMEEMSAWVSAVSQGGWNVLRTKHGHHRSAALWSTENCCNWVQQSKSRRTYQTRLKDNRKIAAAWSGTPCGPGYGDFWILESLFPFGFQFAYRGTENGTQRYVITVTSTICYQRRWLSVQNRDETDEAVQEAVRSWLRGAGTDFYCRGIFKILHHSQKCIVLEWRFCRNAIKDAHILLAPFVFVCMPWFHCRINVLIAFGTNIVYVAYLVLWPTWTKLANLAVWNPVVFIYYVAWLWQVGTWYINFYKC